MTWTTSKLSKRSLIFFGAIFCLLLSITTLLTTSNLSRPTIRSDGEGYYLYLPAVFIHHDLSMKWTQPLWGQSLQLVDHPDLANEWNGLFAYKPGIYLDKYPVGLAMLWLPFFLAAHALTIHTGHPAT